MATRTDASPTARSSTAMNNAAFRQTFGYSLPINDAYRERRTSPDESRVRRLAATPDTSNHGWALAIDVGDQSHYVIGYTHPIYAWFRGNAPRYGWTHPAWAEPDGAGPHEAWYWEYIGAHP